MATNNSNTIGVYTAEVRNLVKSKTFVVFLCGPSIKNECDVGARLRRTIKKALEEEDFDVVLGEDDGLEDARLDYGSDAQTNELRFVVKKTDAVVLIASSTGSYCELGLFSHHVFLPENRKVDLILIMDHKYQKRKSYLNEGPAALVSSMGGMVIYDNLETFDVSVVVERLKCRRIYYLPNAKGRPKEGS